MAVKLTEATTDDRIPVDELSSGLCGKLFGDKGYISKVLQERLFSKGLDLITKIKKGIKKRVLSLFDRVLLRKGAIVESVIDQLKNISQIEHSRHRSVQNFLLNMVTRLTAYSLRPKKPTIDVQFSGIIAVCFLPRIHVD